MKKFIYLLLLILIIITCYEAFGFLHKTNITPQLKQAQRQQVTVLNSAPLMPASSDSGVIKNPAVDPEMLNSVLKYQTGTPLNMQLSYTTTYLINKIYSTGQGLAVNNAVFGFDAVVAKDSTSKIQDVFTSNKLSKTKVYQQKADGTLSPANYKNLKVGDMIVLTDYYDIHANPNNALSEEDIYIQ